MKYTIKYQKDMLDLISDFVNKKHESYIVDINKSNLDNILTHTTIDDLAKATGIKFNLI